MLLSQCFYTLKRNLVWVKKSWVDTFLSEYIKMPDYEISSVFRTVIYFATLDTYGRCAIFPWGQLVSFNQIISVCFLLDQPWSSILKTQLIFYFVLMFLEVPLLLYLFIALMKIASLTVSDVPLLTWLDVLTSSTCWRILSRASNCYGWTLGSK